MVCVMGLKLASYVSWVHDFKFHIIMWHVDIQLHLLSCAYLSYPVAIASEERYFSRMKIVKNVQCNHISDDFMNHYIICFLEQRLLYSTSRKDVIDYFLKMKDRRGKIQRGNYFRNQSLFCCDILATMISYLCEVSKNILDMLVNTS